MVQKREGWAEGSGSVGSEGVNWGGRGARVLRTPAVAERGMCVPGVVEGLH